MCWVMSVADSLNMSGETSMFVSRVFHNTLGAISLIKSVFTMNFVTITMLPLALVILGVRVLNSIFELVARVMMMIVMIVSTMADTVIFVMTFVVAFTMSISVSCSDASKSQQDSEFIHSDLIWFDLIILVLVQIHN